MKNCDHHNVGRYLRRGFIRCSRCDEVLGRYKEPPPPVIEKARGKGKRR